MLKNRGCTIGIVVLIIFIILFLTGLDLYTDLAWLETLGVASILWKKIGTEWLLFIGGWILATLLLGANWRLARSLAGGGQMTVPWLRQQQSQHRVTAEPTTRIVAARVANVLLAVIAAVLGFFFALSARAMWLTARLSAQGVSFGQTDPILNRDLSFYVFRLPWLKFLQGWFLWLVVIAMADADDAHFGRNLPGRVASDVDQGCTRHGDHHQPEEPAL